MTEPVSALIAPENHWALLTILFASGKLLWAFALLIGDHKTQSFILDILGKQCMRADNHIDISVGDHPLHFLFLIHRTV